MSLLTPDRYFSRITRINVRTDLLGCGLTHVLLDIDNTIRSREPHDVPQDVRAWLSAAQEAGVTICLLSNNWHADVHAFAKSLGLPLVAKACKPMPPAYVAAMRKIGGVRRSTVCIGDQFSTDVVGAHLCGMKAFLLTPLAEKDLKHTVVVRKFERKLLGEMQPE